MGRLSENAIYKKYENLEFLAKQVVEGFITGLHKSPFHGFSVEFAEHRMYNRGESTKHIDWRLFARTEKLFVKKFEEETNLRCQIIMDTSSSMYFPAYENKKEVSSKLSFAVECAASLIYMLRKQRDAVGLSVFDETIKLHSDAKSNLAHNKFLFSQLEQIIDKDSMSLNKKSNQANILHEIADKIHKRSLVIIFSDMLDTFSRPEDVFSALQHLKHSKHEVILFHVYDKEKEWELEFENRPLRFIDMETEREMKVNPLQLRDAYKKNMTEFKNALKVKCLQYQIDLVEANINEGFDKVLLSFLRKRAKLL